jgi:diguanylate cyclase (GGDEF)-like protein
MSTPTLDRVLDAVLRVDAQFEIKFVSEGGQRWLGRPVGPTATGNFLDILHPQDVDRFKSALHDSAASFECDLRVIRGTSDRWVNLRGYQISGVQQYVLCLIDISVWKADGNRFRHAAEHDDLTGLPNRAHFKNRIESLLGSDATVFSVALIDLDGFKKVNDTFGHAMGDAVLIETTRRLLKVIGPEDLLARLGGDEFVLLLSHKSAAEACAALKDVLLAVARPYEAAPHDAYIGASIGVAEYPLHGAEYTDLLKSADAAMYHSKSAGKNRISVYEKKEANSAFTIMAAIHDGIQNGDFYLEYQPQYDVYKQLIGVEALMRWTSRDFGQVGPDRFIPIAEEAGLMPFLGNWALRCACHQLRQFQAHAPDLVMSVNVSPVQFVEEGFDRNVLHAIVEAGVNPCHVVLEITESTLMRSQEKTERALAVLRERGIRFSIDDFGTGFSSLAYLTRLPVSSLKIDKAFMRAIENPGQSSVNDIKLISAMIDLAHHIDLKVVAEGVENMEQFDFLKQSGCDLVQGYLLARPMKPEAINALLIQQETLK